MTETRTNHANPADAHFEEVVAEYLRQKEAGQRPAPERYLQSFPELRTQLETMPYEALLQELRDRDSAAYEKIDKQNPRRVIRAVEVIRLTGKKFSEQRAEWKSAVPGSQSIVNFGLARKADDLHARIDARVNEMFRRGLVDETRELLGRGLEQNKTAMQAIGSRVNANIVQYFAWQWMTAWMSS